MQEVLFGAAATELRLRLGESIDSEGKSFYIERGEGRRFVITDIHGSFQTFVNLLEKINLDKSDQLFILGDMINRAPYSLYVIEHVAKLILEGYRVFPLRGNHEQLFLDFARHNPLKLRTLALRQYSMHLLINGEMPQGIFDFFDVLPFYYETDKFLMVHAGFDTGKKNPLSSWNDMLWIRSYPYVKSKLKGKRVIHGHVPSTLDSIKRGIKQGKPDIKLDNGCIRAGVSGFGKLVCLEIDRNELYVQKNADFLPA